MAVAEFEVAQVAMRRLPDVTEFDAVTELVLPAPCVVETCAKAACARSGANRQTKMRRQRLTVSASPRR